MTAPTGTHREVRTSWIERERAHNDLVNEIRDCQSEGEWIGRYRFSRWAHDYGTADDHRELMMAYGPVGVRYVSQAALERVRGMVTEGRLQLESD